MARQGVLPCEAIAEVLRRYQALSSIAHIIAREIPPSIPPDTLRQQKAAVSLHLDTQLQAVFMPLRHVLLLLKKDVAQWQEQQQGRPLVDHPDLAQSYALQSLIDQQAQSAAHEIAAQLRDRPLAEAVFDNSPVGRFLEFLPRWADIALDTPHGSGFTSSKQQILADAQM